MVEVEVIRTATLPTPHGYVFRPGGPRPWQIAAALRPGRPTLACPCLAFVVRHPDAGTIVVDTGLHPDALTDLRKDFGTAMGLFMKSIDPAGAPFDAQLRERGVDPDAVERVVMTHLHVDHTSAMRLLPRARFVTTPQEWRAATGPRAALRGYVAQHLPPRERMDLVDVARDGEAHGPFSRTHDLLGDGSVRLVWTPGHTAGHVSVLLQLAGRRALIVGDAAYTLQSIATGHLPLITTDDGDARRSLEQLAAFTTAEPHALVVPTHDPDAYRTMTS